MYEGNPTGYGWLPVVCLRLELFVMLQGYPKDGAPKVVRSRHLKTRPPPREVWINACALPRTVACFMTVLHRNFPTLKEMSR